MTSRKPKEFGFTLVELVVAMGVFSVFMAALMSSWTAVQTTAVNAMTYSTRQNDQMRAIDYLKRDVRRATKVEIYDAGTLVTGTVLFGNELRLTIPGYYADTREEDNAIGSKTTNPPTLVAGSVTYGPDLPVRYSVLAGAVVRNESGVPRTIGPTSGAFAISFKNETNGSIRCRLLYNQPMQGAAGRTLRRELDVLCFQRSQLQQ
ncbi:MAG: prepilin-type N-terminal cleavage/methylation domain-containing protein [Chthoniobacteraceae bacterium]